MGEEKETRDEEFRSFVIGCWPRLLRTAFLLCGEQHAAEDLVQSALEQAYVAWRRVRAADRPEAYVRRMLINAHARRHRRRLKELLSVRDDTGLARELPDTKDPIGRADNRSALLEALAQLPPRQRQAVVLRYWEDLTETLTAEAMGCSVGTVKSNAAKGIARLRAVPGLSEAMNCGVGT